MPLIESVRNFVLGEPACPSLLSFIGALPQAAGSSADSGQATPLTRCPHADTEGPLAIGDPGHGDGAFMEPSGATGGDRWQMGRRRKRLQQADPQPVATT